MKKVDNGLNLVMDMGNGGFLKWKNLKGLDKILEEGGKETFGMGLKLKGSASSQPADRMDWTDVRPIHPIWKVKKHQVGPSSKVPFRDHGSLPAFSYPRWQRGMMRHRLMGFFRMLIPHLGPIYSQFARSSKLTWIWGI